MDNIEQAKEKLRRILPRLATVSPDKIIYTTIGEALSLLSTPSESVKAEPKQDDGEWTMIKRQIPQTYLKEKVQDENIAYLCRTILEACDRLDAQAEEIERLVSKFHAEKASYESARKEVDRLTAENLRRERRIVFLTAENAKLKELDDILEIKRKYLTEQVKRLEAEQEVEHE